MEAAHEDDSREDAALAERIARGGDGAAEALLCRRLFPRIRAYGMRHLRDEAAASDLAQHVLVVVLEALRANRVERSGRLAAFVMGTCRNTVVEWRKVERRRASVLEKFAPTLPAAAEMDVVSLDAATLARCLEALAPRERAILTLTYFSERDAAEIAEELAMTPGNVRTGRHRALHHMHDCITRGASS